MLEKLAPLAKGPYCKGSR